MAGISRPSWFTSSPRLGTSGSWQTIANERVPTGAPDQESCGLRLPDSVTCDFGSMRQNANSAGIGWPSAKDSLKTLIDSFSLAARLRGPQPNHTPCRRSGHPAAHDQAAGSSLTRANLRLPTCTT